MAQARDRLGYLAMLAIGLGALWMSRDFAPESAIFPRIVAGTMAIMAAAHLLASFRSGRAEPVAAEPDASGGYQLEPSDGFFDDPLRFATIFVLSLLYCIGVGAVGYYTATILLVPVAAFALGIRSVRVIALSTLLYVVSTYLIISVLFSRTLPPERLLSLFN